jgi:tellurite resistance protein TehA-like permease/glutaredoxin
MSFLSLEMKRTLAANGVSFAAFEVNETSVGRQIQDVLKTKTGIATVPILFVKGESKGGCMDIKDLENSGQLAALLAPYVGLHKNRGPEINHLGLLWFPDTANGHVARLTGLFTCIYSILCVIFYRNFATPWAMLALALDSFVRFTYGSSHSILGTIATALLIRVPPKWTAGPPKQFAALCAVFFATLSAGLYLGGQDIGGAVVAAALAAAAALEGVLDFCVGCFFFGLGITFGIVPASVYQPYLNLLPDRKWGHAYMNEKRTFPAASNEHYLLPGQTEPTKVDLIRKDRLELEYKLQDVDLVRHTRVEFFAIPMAIAALAYFFKLTDNTHPNSDFDGGFVYQVLAIFSVVLCGLIGIFYVLRMVMYPHKVVKEWFHPVMGNYFSAITICITLYGLLLLPKSTNGGGALIWIGSIGQMFIAVTKLSHLIYHPFSDEFLNASVMMAPVGNYLSTLGFVIFGQVYNGPDLRGEVNYVYLARLWFAIATLFAIVLFTLTLKRSFNDHYSDQRTRPTLYVWLATASVAGPAFLAVSADPSAGTGLFFQSMWYIALFFFVIFGMGWLHNFFGYTPDLSIWIVPFSLSAFAIATLQYQIETSSELFTTLSIIAGAVACASMAVCGAHTLAWMLDLSLWTPRQKWGPISFMKLTHEAMRMGVPKINTILVAVDGSNPVAVDNLIMEMENFFATYVEHGRHEDLIIFPAVRRYFPGLNPSMSEEHEFEHLGLERMRAEIKKYREVTTNKGGDNTSPSNSSPVAAATDMLTALREQFPAWGDHLLHHMRNEENTVTVVVRKYIPLDYQIQMSAQVYDVTSGEAWRVVMPYVVNHLPAPTWKVRYIRTFIWANPMRAQEIGLILYPNLDTVTWTFLAREIPEMIPRGLSGFDRYY